MNCWEILCQLRLFCIHWPVLRSATNATRRITKSGKGGTFFRAPNHYGDAEWLLGGAEKSQQRHNYFNTVHLSSMQYMYSNDFRFEHEGAKLASCLGRHLTSLRLWMRHLVNCFPVKQKVAAEWPVLTCPRGWLQIKPLFCVISCVAINTRSSWQNYRLWTLIRFLLKYGFLVVESTSLRNLALYVAPNRRWGRCAFKW